VLQDCTKGFWCRNAPSSKNLYPWAHNPHYIPDPAIGSRSQSVNPRDWGPWGLVDASSSARMPYGQVVGREGVLVAHTGLVGGS
jgi:hypothetical protein